jgi:hypothetical protein
VSGFFSYARATMQRFERAAAAMEEVGRANDVLAAENRRLLAEVARVRGVAGDQALKIIEITHELAMKRRFIDLQFVDAARRDQEFAQVATERNRLRRLAHNLLEYMHHLGMTPAPLTKDDVTLLSAPSYQSVTINQPN